MKRVFWTVGLALFGLYFGWNGQGADLNAGRVLTATLWTACIGFGFGSIFDRRVSGKWRIFYWAGTLGLLGLFFGPLLPSGGFIVRQVLGALIAALVGLVVGTLELRFGRRNSHSPGASAVG